MGVESLFVVSNVLSGAGIQPGSIFGIANLFQRQPAGDEHQEHDIHGEQLHLSSFTEDTTRTSRSTSPRVGD